MLSVIEIDREHDLAYILLRPKLRDQRRGVARSVRVGEDIVLDLDKNQRLIGIELLNASSRLDLNNMAEGAADLIVGVKEAAAMLGIEKSNFVRDYANKSQFPKPVAELASGRFWLRADVERYMQRELNSSGFGRTRVDHILMEVLEGVMELLGIHGEVLSKNRAHNDPPYARTYEVLGRGCGCNSAHIGRETYKIELHEYRCEPKFDLQFLFGDRTHSAALLESLERLAGYNEANAGRADRLLIRHPTRRKDEWGTGRESVISAICAEAQRADKEIDRILKRLSGRPSSGSGGHIEDINLSKAWESRPASSGSSGRETYPREGCGPGSGIRVDRQELERRQGQLLANYRERWPDFMNGLAEARRGRTLANPWLVDLTANNYAEAPVKLVVVGKQSNDYETVRGQLSVDELLQVYRNSRLNERYPGIPFYRAAHGLYRLLNPNGPPNGFIWNNLVKVEDNNDRPGPEVEHVLLKYFNVIPTELRLAQPDVVVFFTGPDYDDILSWTFRDVRLVPANQRPERVLARLEGSDTVALPRNSFRTYHPDYLNRFCRRPPYLWDVIKEIAELVRHDDSIASTRMSD